jgi:DNA polymerase
MRSVLGVHELIEELIRSLHRMGEAGWRGFDCSPENLSILRNWGAAPEEPSPPDTLSRIRTDLGECRRCALCRTRTQIVFGSGNSEAKLVFVGAQLEYEDDQAGVPFTGPAGRLLTRIIAAMKLNREAVYLCNIVKCRPPENRNPLKQEIEACLPFLKRQIDTIAPTVICTLGSLPAQILLENDLPIGQLRGRFYDFRGRKLMPTFHPLELLRHPEKKRETWADVQKIMRFLNIPVG